VLEIVKREASTTSIRSDVIQGAHAIRPFTRDGRMPSRVSGRRASASALDDRQPVDVGPVCQARKRFGRRWVGPPGPSVKSPVPGARRRSGVQRAPPPGGGDPRSPMTGGRTSTRRVRIHGDSERGDLPRGGQARVDCKALVEENKKKRRRQDRVPRRWVGFSGWR